MSGGTWNYQQHRLEEKADEIATILRAVAQTEHIIDWSEACDTSRQDAEREVYDLWVKTFNEVFG